MKHLLYLFIILINSTIHAQSNENIFKKIHIEVDGEEVFDVSAITQDHQGFIWMATNLGLIRYDGLEGKKYYSDSSSDDNGGINTLYVDSQGDLWIGSISGLRKFNPDCDCILQYPSKNADFKLSNIEAITEDLDKNIWIGTLNEGLIRYNRESKDFTRVFHNSSDSIKLIIDKVFHLLVDQKNNLWIGGSRMHNSIMTYGLARYNISTGNVEQFSHDPANPNSLVDSRIRSLYEDQYGQILIGTYQSGFHIYDPTTESVNRMNVDSNNPNRLHAPYTESSVFGQDPSVQLIHQDQNGDYWIGASGKGINYFNTKTNTFKNYSFNLVNPQVLMSIYEDRQGNIWIGGIMGAGLFKADLFERKYQFNKNFKSIGSSYESAFNPGILWVNSLQLGLSKLNLKTNEIKRYVHDKSNSKSIGHNWVRSTYQENKETIWFGIGFGGADGNSLGDGGIDRMDIASETFKHFKLTRNDDGIDGFSYTPYSICEDKEGYLWVTGGKGGLFRSNKEKNTFNSFKLTNNDDTNKDVILNKVNKDSNGDIWASDFKDEGTLYLYNREEDTFKPYLNGFKVFNILIDEQGWYIIGTWKKGLLHLNPVTGSIIQYTKKDGLPSNSGVDIIAGDDGVFWVQTRMGPAKFDSKTGKISSIGLLKGMYNTSIMKASDGQIYLGDKKRNGLVSFHPNQVMGNPYPPQIDISEMLISDSNYLAGKNNSNELNLSYNQNDISFKYNALHFSDPEKNQYQYRLKPIDNEWTDAGFERSARYFNLPPDDYTFEVKASNRDGVWNETPETVTFTIKPAWWTTWWAYLIYISLFAFLTERLYRFQLSKKMVSSESRRLKEINQLKNTLFTNITHEFRTPLTVIKGMTGSIKSNLENKHLDDLENSLEMIDRNSDGLLHLVNEMLDLAKIESGKMELQLEQADIIPFIKYLCESFNSLAEENQVSLTIYSELDTLIMDFDANKLTSVISNLLSNATKFTPEYGKIIVHIKQIIQKEKTFLFIKIKDSGIGISNQELPYIFNRFYQADATTIRKNEGAGIGLALTKELVEVMHGTIEVKSTLNKGSEFSIMLPVTRKSTVSKNTEINNLSHSYLSHSSSIHTEQILEINSELPLVLIIEDNMDVAFYLKTCLLNKYETIHAVNGIVGIEMALEKIPDIIICDVMMPGKDGFEVCTTLKSDERSDHIPIIILTAKVTIEDRLTGLSHGADAYLAKPFNKEELFTRLDQLVTLRKKLISKIHKDGFNTLLKNRTKNPKLQFLQKVVKIIHKNIDNAKFGSAELAKNLFISDSQIYRKIRAITGKSTAVFIRSIRLKYAKELLSNTDKTVSEVAYEAGFNDPSWFSRAFKNEFGASPSSSSK